MDRAIVSREQCRKEVTEWCGVFQGLLVILMVTGKCSNHSAQIIFQFHIAAFFFISGYTTRLENSLVDDIIKKFCQWIIPYFVLNFFGVMLFWGLHLTGLLKYVSTSEFPEDFREILAAFICGRLYYCDWLETLWFLPVLFGAFVIFRIIVNRFNKYWVILVASLLVYWTTLAISIFCFLCIKTVPYGNNNYLELIGLAQFFITCGYLVSERSQGNEYRLNLVMAGTLLIGIIWMIIYKLGFRKVLNWSLKGFCGWLDFIVPILGIAFVLGLSMLLNRCFVRKILDYLGRYLFAVMILHLVGFKAAYALLILVGKMDRADFRFLQPPEQISQSEGLCALICTLSIMFCILFWQFLCKNRRLGALLGNERDLTIFYVIVDSSEIQNVKSNMCAIFNRIQKRFFCLNKSVKLLLAKYVLLIISLIAMICYLVVAIWEYRGMIQTVFPNKGQFYLDEGWLPQMKGETHRWMKKRAIFGSFLFDQNRVIIKGYIPGDVTNASYIQLSLNGQKVLWLEVKEDFLIDLDVDISNYVNPFGMNAFEIETDAMKIPGEKDADVREFSALFSSLTVKK